MNKDELEGKWKQMKGSAKENWGKLTDDDLDEIQGRKQILVGKIQERYGQDRAAAEEAVDSWMNEQDDRRTSH